jgi:hypothetical protein
MLDKSARRLAFSPLTYVEGYSPERLLAPLHYRQQERSTMIYRL